MSVFARLQKKYVSYIELQMTLKKKKKKASPIKIMACEEMRLAPFVRNVIVRMGWWHNESCSSQRPAENVIRPHKPFRDGSEGRGLSELFIVTGGSSSVCTDERLP